MSLDTELRIGQGYDVHRLVEGRKLILGGVEIPYDMGLDGHSDADALTHAIADALLGSLAMGDIGVHFPPTDDRWKDADSIELLRHVVELLRKRGARVVNVDSTVIAQAPKIAPYAQLMRERLCATMGVKLDCVSVKATTPEMMGAFGRREGIAAQAVALVCIDG
jgi:2-C-methyl-D-erythritol 2,4-cyclodiphosphate synthase